MFVLLLAAAATTPSPVLPNSWSPKGEARTVIERQLRAPPRENAAGGLAPEEADAILGHYLATIGTGLGQVQQPAPARTAPQQ